MMKVSKRPYYIEDALGFGGHTIRINRVAFTLGLIPCVQMIVLERALLFERTPPELTVSVVVLAQCWPDESEAPCPQVLCNKLS